MAAVSRRPEAHGVLAEMNLTPLIDVLLVLIVMLIITVPVSTHAVKLDLPGESTTEVSLIRNVIVVERDGTLVWNGKSVDRQQLRDLLDRSAALAVAPELHLRPVAWAPYRVVDEVLAMTKRANLTKVGFVGNEAYRKF